MAWRGILGWTMPPTEMKLFSIWSMIHLMGGFVMLLNCWLVQIVDFSNKQPNN
jgi:hypothetical protein